MWGSLGAQSRKELESKKKRTLNELATIRNMLSKTQKSKTNTVYTINLLNQDIKKSQTYIQLLNEDINLLDQELDSLKGVQLSLDTLLEHNKKDYADMVWSTYKYNHYFSPALFIFSSEDFNQAFRRFRYLQDFSSYRSQQIENISQVQAQIEEQLKKIETTRELKHVAYNSKSQEAERLSVQKAKQSRVLSKLRKDEKSLKKKQRAKQNQANKLAKQIEALIASEMKKNQGKNISKATAKEIKLVSGNFEKNKGKLPYPVKNGHISSHFGVHPHPVLKHVTVDNKGTYFQAPAGSDALVIYDGTVTKCFTIPGGNSAIIVQHGAYRTVYSNLTKFYVKPGEKVKTGQKIGKIFIDNEDGDKTELFILLYHNIEVLNPELWIRP